MCEVPLSLICWVLRQSRVLSRRPGPVGDAEHASTWVRQLQDEPWYNPDAAVRQSDGKVRRQRWARHRSPPPRVAAHYRLCHLQPRPSASNAWVGARRRAKTSICVWYDVLQNWIENARWPCSDIRPRPLRPRRAAGQRTPLAPLSELSVQPPPVPKRQPRYRARSDCSAASQGAGPFHVWAIRPPGSREGSRELRRTSSRSQRC